MASYGLVGLGMVGHLLLLVLCQTVSPFKKMFHRALPFVVGFI